MSDNPYPHGTFCWNECMSTDVEKSKKFYTDLIGWQAEEHDMGAGPYTVMKSGDKMTSGMMAMPPEAKDVPSHWMAYIAVDNVDELAEKAKTLGGNVIHGPMDIPTVGRFVVLQDPAGAVVSLITMEQKSE